MALTFTACAVTVAGAQFTVGRTRRNACIGGVTACAIGSSPAGLALTRATNADTALVATAQHTLVTFAREIIAFTELAGDDFLLIGTLITFAYAAHALTAATAID